MLRARRVRTARSRAKRLHDPSGVCDVTPQATVDQQRDARSLYAQGIGIDEIAAHLGVSARAVYRWRARDAKVGADWDKARAAYRTEDPQAFLVTLRRVRVAIAQRLDKAAQAGEDVTALADALLKVDQVRARESERFGNLEVQLGVLGEMAEWAATVASAEDLAVYRRLVDDYLADLKRRHA